jgi:CRP-like cAMP-binding protein
MTGIVQMSVSNRLLANLSADDFGDLSSHLHRVDLPYRATLYRAGKAIPHAFFPEVGYAVMLAGLEGGAVAEVGMIGSEGMISVPLIFGCDRSPVEAMVQGAGSALRLGADVFQRALNDRGTFRAHMLRYAMAFNYQITMTAACNSHHVLEQRLARWLLMAHDRVHGDEFAMTHALLSMMLSVRRASVSVAANVLQRAGFIRHGGGSVRITNRSGLENVACGCHFLVMNEFERLFGPVPSKQQEGNQNTVHNGPSLVHDRIPPPRYRSSSRIGSPPSGTQRSRSHSNSGADLIAVPDGNKSPPIFVNRPPGKAANK